MRKPFIIVFLLLFLLPAYHINAAPFYTESILKAENGLGKKKKKKNGYKRPKSKKFLGIFKRKTDCGCPSH